MGLNARFDKFSHSQMSARKASRWYGYTVEGSTYSIPPDYNI